jgi:excisionase family DNA binding protein
MANGKQLRRRERKEPSLPEGVMTTSQATKELGISAATLRRWVKEGRVEAMKVGKQLRFRQADLRRVITLQPSEAPLAVEAAPEVEVRRCEQTFDRLLRAQGVKLERAEMDINRELRRLTKENDLTSARLLAKMLFLAVVNGASDLHIEPFETSAKVRFRVDGLLTDVIELPKSLSAAMVAELERWSNLKVGEKSRPQDGRVMLNFTDRGIDFRLSTMPAFFGEVVALRLLDRSVQLPDLSRLGFEPDQLARWRRILHRPNGLVLVNGPAGCGKTTVLYASLTELVDAGVKIMTAEDPVEFTIPGISQVEIRPSVGLDFVTVARHMMRQALNVMFIGEIRDRETAEILCTAAMTGHLVFSTMHANDAVLCIRRLIEMGVERNVLASSILAVTAQRLLRTICIECKEEYRPSERELFALNIPRDKLQGKFYHGKGCARCRGLGYRGRAAVIELLELNSQVREGIVRDDDNLRLREAARPAGFRLMTELAMDKILRGETTIEEVVRIGLVAQAPA